MLMPGLSDGIAVVAGMFDFQMVVDMNIACIILRSEIK
jgi:hypothetical protein